MTEPFNRSDLDESTTTKIRGYLRSIEEVYECNVVTAWLGGSHAWGVASKNSDFDIYFLYTQQLTDYVSIGNYDKTYQFSGEHIEDGVAPSYRIDDIEFTGWDMRNFGEMLLESNPMAVEILSGGVPIKTHPVIPDLREYVENRFHNIELYQHYCSYTRSHYRRYLLERDQPYLKRLLYLLRAAISAQYIRLEKDFPPEASREIIPSDVYDVFTDRIERKQNGESDTRIVTELQQVESFITEILSLKVGSDQFNHTDHIPEETIDKNDIDSYILQIVTGYQKLHSSPSR